MLAMILSVLTYLSMFAVLCSFFVLTKWGKEYQFFVVNFVTSIPLFLSAYVVGLIPNAVLSAFFGAVGLYGILTKRPAAE